MAASAPAKVIVTLPGSGPPVQTTLPVPMLESACSAACTCAAVALNEIAAVVWPPNDNAKVPPAGAPPSDSV